MQSIILGIETSTEACSVAITTPKQVHSVFVLEPQAHSKLLLGMVEEMRLQAGIELQDINAFAFGRGPGSFTGVRIAASIIQGLAFGLDKPVLAISSLQALAQQALNKNPIENILAIFDARMYEIYCGFYTKNAAGYAQSKVADFKCVPEELKIASSTNQIAVGTGAQAYSEILSQHYPNLLFDLSIQYPRAQEVVQLAVEQLANGNILTAAQAVPTYIRDDVVQTGKKNPD